MSGRFDRGAAKARQARYQQALDRPELRGPGVPRIPADGPVSHALKVLDPDTRRLVDEVLARRGNRP